MRLSILFLAYLGTTCIQTVLCATLHDVFVVKSGTDKGGCDGVEYNVEEIFNEASTIILEANKAFKEYNTDFQIRKLALNFFNIQMNSEMTAIKDEANKARLKAVQDGFQSLQDVVTATSSYTTKYTGGKYEKIWLFCDSDWVEKAANGDDFKQFNSRGQLVSWVIKKNAQGYEVEPPALEEADDKDIHTPRARVLESLTIEEVDERPLVKGEVAAYLSRDLGLYRLGDTEAEKVIHWCAKSGSRGLTSALKSKIAMTLCLRTKNFIRKPLLNTNSKSVSVFLQELEMHSLTLIHELFHAGRYGGDSDDQATWGPSTPIDTRLPDGSRNPAWPGDISKLTLLRNDKGNPVSQADSVTDILLLSLVNGQKSVHPTKNDEIITVKVEFNPQNYAWAAMATWLARNGAHMDYSSGFARPLDKNNGLDFAPQKPPSPPTHKRSLKEFDLAQMRGYHKLVITAGSRIREEDMLRLIPSS